MKVLVFILFGMVAQAEPLRLVYPEASDLSAPVSVNFRSDGNILKASFEVAADSINAKPELGSKEFPFQFDVVEIFFSVSSTRYPYYELEVSPYNQSFQVRVDGYKKPFLNNVETGFSHKAEITKTGWTVEMEIPLQNLDWNGDSHSIVGNAYAILGKSPNRSFWSLYLPKLSKPNFHQPQYFRPLLN